MTAPRLHCCCRPCSDEYLCSLHSAVQSPLSLKTNTAASPFPLAHFFIFSYLLAFKSEPLSLCVLGLYHYTRCLWIIYPHLPTFHIMVWSQSVSPCDWPHWMLSSWIFSSSWLRSARSWTAHHYNQRALTCSDFQEHFKNPQKNTGSTGNMAIVEIKGNRNKGFSVLTLMSFCSQRHTCRNTSVGKTE